MKMKSFSSKKSMEDFIITPRMKKSRNLLNLTKNIATNLKLEDYFHDLLSTNLILNYF